MSSQTVNRKIGLLAAICVLFLAVAFLILLLSGLHEFDKINHILDHRKMSSRTQPQDLDSHDEVVKVSHKSEKGDTFDWSRVVPPPASLPQTVEDATELVTVMEKTASIGGSTIFYREAGSSDAKLSVLLLHGMAYSSKTWLDLKTISVLAAYGHRVVAVDLPGFGQSTGLPNRQQKNFLSDLCKTLGLERPVIISPSMSGRYALPLLVDEQEKLSGFIPVAPVGSEVLERKNCSLSGSNEQSKKLPGYLQKLISPPYPDVSCIKVPTLVVHGELDRGKSSALLALLPNSRVFEIPDAGHAAYLKDPGLWHRLLYAFLEELSRIEQ